MHTLTVSEFITNCKPILFVGRATEMMAYLNDETKHMIQEQYSYMDISNPVYKSARKLHRKANKAVTDQSVTGCPSDVSVDANGQVTFFNQ